MDGPTDRQSDLKSRLHATKNHVCVFMNFHYNCFFLFMYLCVIMGVYVREVYLKTNNAMAFEI